MKPHVTAESVAAFGDHLLIFSRVLSNIDPKRLMVHQNRKNFDRVMKRAVKTLEVLKHEYGKVYDDLQFLDGSASLWMFLYIQSGTPIEECVRLIARLVAPKARAASKVESKLSRTWLKADFDWCELPS